MSRLPRWSLVAALLVVAGAAVALGAVTWKERADDICAKETAAQGGYALEWKWDEFAYVCDYQAPAEPPRRVGLLDAFHSGGRQRHRP